MKNREKINNGRSSIIKTPTLPASYAEFKSAAEAGALYVDIVPNDSLESDAGVSEIGTPLNTSTLLKDSTCALLGLTTEAVPDDALVKIGNELEVINTITFSVNDWTLRSGGYEAVKTVSGITVNSKPIPSLHYSLPLSESQCKTESKAYGKVRKFITGNGSITAQASLLPTAAFTVDFRGI